MLWSDWMMGKVGLYMDQTRDFVVSVGCCYVLYS